MRRPDWFGRERPDTDQIFPLLRQLELGMVAATVGTDGSWSDYTC
jgi:hypothetical protein